MAETGQQMNANYSIAYMLVGFGLAVLSLWLSAVIVRASAATLLRSMLGTGLLGSLTLGLGIMLGRVEPAWQIALIALSAILATGIVRAVFQATVLQAIGIVVLCVMMQAIFAALWVQATQGKQAEPEASALFAVDHVMCYNHHASYR